MKLQAFVALGLALLPGRALAGLFDFLQYPDGALPACVPFLIDEKDTGGDICINKIDGLLKKVQIELPRRTDYDYEHIYLDWSCSAQNYRDKTLYPYRSPLTGCKISDDKHGAICEIYTALYTCSGCNEKPWIAVWADMRRKSDNKLQVGSGTGQCIKYSSGLCATWVMTWPVTLTCGKGTGISSRTLNLLTSTAAPATLEPATEGEQCGGTGWTGTTKCLANYTCHKVRDDYHVCKYNGEEVQVQGEQCGGLNWWGRNRCGADEECYGWTPEKHVCRSTKVCEKRGSQCGGKHSDGRLWWGPSKCPTNHACHKRDENFHGCRSEEIQKKGGQCGGRDPETKDFWWGPHKCESDCNCEDTSDVNRKECREVVAAAVGATATTSAAVELQTPGGQCGGAAWTGPGACVAGYKCRRFTDHWSECRPDAEGGRQCGGEGWTGETACPSGESCRKFTKFYHQCMPDSDNGAGRQCGGQTWQGDTVCPVGFTCRKFTDFYSQCIADSNTATQCGGQGWTGATNCPTGYTCKKFTQYYSQCVSTANIGTGDQCGGKDWTGETTCPMGFTCKRFTDEYSQCIPDADLDLYNMGAVAATQPYVMLCTANP